MLLRLTIRRRSPGYAYAECPLCGDRRGKLCLNLTKDVWYSNCCGDHGGMLSLYAKVRRTNSNSEAYWEICDELRNGTRGPDYEVQRKEYAPKQKAVQSERATDQEIHHTYSTLLSMLVLNPGHHNHLRTVRGLSDEQIRSFGFKSTPPPYLCRTITRKLIEHGCTVQGVPGFYVDDSGKWTVRFFKRTAGILVPYLSVDGKILGLQTRLDVPFKHKDDPPEKKGTKYLWLATSDKKLGVSSGSPVHFVGDPCARVVYVTEGALKADIVHALTGRTLVATGGAGCVEQLDDMFSFLYRNGTEEIIEAQDMDKFSNQGVGRGASKVFLLAKKHGMDCRRLTWDPNYKGFDDWQLALRRKKKQNKECETMNFKERYLSGECSLEDIAEYAERWTQISNSNVGLCEYLGFTREEYAAYLQTDVTVSFEELMEAQRRHQKFRIYQLDLPGAKVIPFAFKEFDALIKAGFQQPPAAEYQMVYDGEICCPKSQDEQTVLGRIFNRCNASFPDGYSGHSMAPSDVVELYGDEKRRYFYRNADGFVEVQFSPALAKPKTAVEPQLAEHSPPVIDSELLKEKVEECSSIIHISQVRIACQENGGHEADVFYFQPGGSKISGVVPFSGATFQEAFCSLVNALNTLVGNYSKNVRKMLLKPHGGGLRQYQVCSKCGGTNLYELEFRTDYAIPGKTDPVNAGTPELKPEDLPYRIGGTFCKDCEAFCSTETRYGVQSEEENLSD